MLVWVDGQFLQTENRFRGIGRYAGELIGALGHVRPDWRLAISFNAALPHDVVVDHPCLQPWGLRVSVHRWESLGRAGEVFAWEHPKRRLGEVALRHHVLSVAPDVVLQPSLFEGGDDGAVPFLPVSEFPAAQVSVFYDAIPHRFPTQYLRNPARKRFYARRLAAYQAFDGNLCISAFCEAEARALFPGRAAANIMSGVAPAAVAVSHDAQVAVPAPYLLYIGGLDWRKNVGVAVKAFALLPAALQHAHSLVIAGRNATSEEDALRQAWGAAGLAPEKLLFLGHVSDGELAVLYRGCRVVLQPSRMEGFGLTAAEAMKAGAPVVGGRAGALPEVIGCEELLFDPDKPEELAGILTALLSDDAFRARMIAHCQRHVAQFTWEHTAELAAQAIEQWVAARSPRKLSLAEARQWSLRHLQGLDLPVDVIAGIMARAEPE